MQSNAKVGRSATGSCGGEMNLPVRANCVKVNVRATSLFCDCRHDCGDAFDGGAGCANPVAVHASEVSRNSAVVFIGSSATHASVSRRHGIRQSQRQQTVTDAASTLISPWP